MQAARLVDGPHGLEEDPLQQVPRRSGHRAVVEVVRVLALGRHPRDPLQFSGEVGLAPGGALSRCVVAQPVQPAQREEGLV